METYTLLLKEEAPIPAAALAADLTPVVGRPTGELTKGFREHPWILVDELSSELLDPVFDVLKRHQVVAKAVPSAHMPMLPPAWRVKVADPTPESFFLEFAEPPAPPVLRWEELEVVSGGLVTLTADEAPRIFGSWTGMEKATGSHRSLDSTPGSAPLSGSRRTAPEPLLVDLFAAGDEPWRLRIDAGNFKYDYLGDRMATSSRENLKSLLGDIRERAPHARWSERTLRLLAGEPAASFRFRSLAAFEAYHRWVIQAFEEEPPDDE